MTDTCEELVLVLMGNLLLPIVCILGSPDFYCENSCSVSQDPQRQFIIKSVISIHTHVHCYFLSTVHYIHSVYQLFFCINVRKMLVKLCSFVCCNWKNDHRELTNKVYQHETSYNLVISWSTAVHDIIKRLCKYRVISGHRGRGCKTTAHCEWFSGL